MQLQIVQNYNLSAGVEWIGWKREGIKFVKLLSSTIFKSTIHVKSIFHSSFSFIQVDFKSILSSSSWLRISNLSSAQQFQNSPSLLLNILSWWKVATSPNWRLRARFSECVKFRKVYRHFFKIGVVIIIFSDLDNCARIEAWPSPFIKPISGVPQQSGEQK